MHSNQQQPLLLGAHTSAAKGLFNALYAGREIKASTVQLFTANQRRWAFKKILPEEKLKWEKALKETSLSHIMSHGSYLINLASCNSLLLTKSKKALSEELKRCHDLKIKYLTIHPGSYINTTKEKGLNTLIKSILSLEKIIAEGSTKLLLETTAGQGSTLGSTFDELAYILNEIKNKINCGICMDTCHIFSAGYDIRTKKSWEITLQEFTKKIKISYLSAFHLNDSLNDLGSKKDRHTHLGKGKIGIDCFKILMKDKKLKHLPKYLETPDSRKWEEEIKLLKKFAET